MNFGWTSRLSIMSKCTTRLAPLFLAVSIVAAACGSSGPASDQALSAPDTQSSSSDAPRLDESDDEASTSSTVTPTTIAPTTVTPTTLVEALAFQDGETLAGNQLWTDVSTVSVAWTVDFPSDPAIEITGAFSSGEGLTVRWFDPLDGDVLLMLRDDQVMRAFRVGNEVFIGEIGEEQRGLFFAQLLSEVLTPLETGVLPNSANTFVEVNGVRSENPDVFYALAPDASEGTILLGNEWTVDVADQGAITYPIPEGEVVLVREEVGNSGNELLRDWYLDQAG